MRYDSKICFVTKEANPHYDYKTGNYVKGESKKEWSACLISDMGAEMMQFLFGRIETGAKTLAIPGNVNLTGDYVMDSEGTRYSILLRQEARHDTILQVKKEQ